MRFDITPSDHQKSVRAFLFEQGVSAGLLARLKRREDGILQNGTHVTVRAVLSAGDVLEIALEDSEANERLVPLQAPLHILYEDEGVLVVNKPPFMPTHPSHGHYDDTLANVLYYHYGQSDPAFRPRFINRLDRNTSGVVLVAKHTLAAASLSQSMAKGEMQKTYLALVKGRVEGPLRIEGGIRRRAESIIFREVCAPGEGDYALTEARTLFATENASLVLLTPKTGRTHQLRVHMASVGHPLLGDDLYGAEDGVPRHLLHAANLRFPLPRKGQTLSLTAPLPPDFEAVLRTLGKEALSAAQSAISEL